ncbi:MAG: alpha-glucuronidase family glycosyl hydrolase, partial [Armatimonadetes bacterium]|nr:alpha-glucuronidase family glycosyl hydrolase [Armatimonadota bacterium]
MRITQLAALLAALSLMISGQVQAKDMTLAKNGRSSYTIVLSKGASPSEKHAADELQSLLFQISGAKLPIAVEGAKLPKQMIVLGDGAALKSLSVPIDFKDLGDEGFVIKTVGPHLVIAGGRLRGTMYGVYTFLEDTLGCRWYSSYVSYIPKKPTIILKPLDITQKPDFEYREPYYSDAFDADWAARNKANG